MRTADEWFDLYGESHQNTTNKIIHWICVPTIFFTTLVMLCSIRLGFFPESFGIAGSVGGVVLVLAMVFYFRMSPRLFVGMATFTFACWLAMELMFVFLGDQAWKAALALFGVAWVFQFIGHRIEGKKPSFLTDLQFLFVGPAWLMHFIYKKIGISY